MYEIKIYFRNAEIFCKKIIFVWNKSGEMKVLLSIVLGFSTMFSWAQATIHFSRQIHDFGIIKEVDGLVACDFEFVNKGQLPILLKEVESSCGCASVEWSKQPVLPGQKGLIKVVFDPLNRPGTFYKTIRVHSNADPAEVELKIRGMVEKRLRTQEDDYPYELANGLYVRMGHIALMKVFKGEMKNMVFEVLNHAGKQLFLSFVDLPPHIQMNVAPQTVDDQKTAVIEVLYNTALHGEYGLNKERVTMLVDGKPYSLPVSIFIEEDMSGVDLQTAPKIEADKRYYHFGEIGSLQPLEYTYCLKNVGLSPLKIRRVYTNDERVLVEMARQELESGESTELIVRTRPMAERGRVNCLISVICNDPFTPEFTLRFYGNIN